MPQQPFSGSYHSEEVEFLLKPIAMASTDITEKERLIQTGTRHYSEMITRENLPSERYLEVFHQAFQLNRDRLAADCLTLAQEIAQRRTDKEIVLVSLARAGTPIGVLLTHILRKRLQRQATHYSISIIRDRGVDDNALEHILARHHPTSLVFVDGWTGKGVISRELAQSINARNKAQDLAIDPGLFVLSDLSGHATAAANSDDYLIPSSILNATVSGLISRSILNQDYIAPDDFHGCLFYQEFAEHDLSRWFIEQVLERLPAPDSTVKAPENRDPAALRAKSLAFLENIQTRFAISDINRIKPGIGEATRVLLRRVPDLLLLRDKNSEDVRHLVCLAEEKHVPIEEDPQLTYRACALIKEVKS